MSKKQAETQASLECEQFSEARRALKEVEAEKDYLNQLTGAVKLNDKK